ncbi:MAG: winged helix-turn-helix transcriptional regulator [Aeromicrobium sp.]
MTTRTYGQHCGMALAMDVLGERWAMLIVRDLLVAPQRFTDLRRELRGIPSNILTRRLKELEEAGVVERRVLARPQTGTVYALTPEGEDLEEVVEALGLWGARRLEDPRAGDVITASSMTMAMRTTFRPEATEGVHATYELTFGDIVLAMTIDDGGLTVGPGTMPDADVRVSAGPDIRRLMTGEIDVPQAIAESIVAFEGDLGLLGVFSEAFRIGARPGAYVR